MFVSFGNFSGLAKATVPVYSNGSAYVMSARLIKFDLSPLNNIAVKVPVTLLVYELDVLQAWAGV